MEREIVEVNTMSPRRVPDPKWKHVDGGGHAHVWVGETIPTVEWVVTGTEWVGDEYDACEIDVGEYRCRKCGELVEPKRIVTYEPHFLPGLLRITITTEFGSYWLRQEELEEFSKPHTKAELEALAWRVAESRVPDTFSPIEVRRDY
jgi:hypothetical protein